MKKIFYISLALIGVFIIRSCDTTNAPPQYKVSISAQPAEGGTVSPDSGIYKSGTPLEITATPSTGWRFVRWKGGYSSTSFSDTVIVKQDMNIIGVFEKKNYPLTVTWTGEGLVTEHVIQAQTTEYPYQTKVKLTAIPDTGWKFDRWRGDLSGSNNPATITVDAAKNVTAVFVIKSFTVTASASGNGTVTKSPDQNKYDYNSTVTLTATPSIGWKFVKWKGDTISTANPLNLTIREDVSLTAIFQEDGSSGIVEMRLTQSTQNKNRSVHMVAGRDAALRLFLRTNEQGKFNNALSVKLFANGAKFKELNAPAGTLSLHPYTNDISVLNVPVSGNLIRQGLSVKVETSNGWMFPEGGAPLSITVKDAAEFHIRFIPIYVPSRGATGDVNSQNTDEYMEAALDMFPIDDYVVDLHNAVTVNPDTTTQRSLYSTALSDMHALWLAEGQPDYYYYGVIPQNTGGIVGLGYLDDPQPHAYRQAVGWDYPGYQYRSQTMAHELGHNIGRSHAPCGGPAGPDPNYPYPNAIIGAYGYEVDRGELKEPTVYKDLMSYCEPAWISDYTYKAVMKFREKANSTGQAYSRPQEVLLLWGQITNNKLVLKPAFRIEAPASMPQKPGPYTLSGFDDDGRQLFSFSFSGVRVADLNGMRHFAFAVPIDRVQINQLQTIQVSGQSLEAMQQASVPARMAQNKAKLSPNVAARRINTKTVSLQWSNSRYQMALVRNAHTGEVIGFINRSRSEIKTDAKALKVYFSDGVHTVEQRVDI